MASCAVQLIDKVTKKKVNVRKFETHLLKELQLKHPLQNRRVPAHGNFHGVSLQWGLWFYKNDKSKMWQDNLRIITKFDTVEDFWGIYNNIQLPSKLSSGCDYSMFKDGIEPMWEDRSNKCGGRWLITLAKQHRHTELDHFWLETLLCLIGESFGSFSRDICGSVINIRAKGDKIALWTSNAENCETVTYIGERNKGQEKPYNYQFSTPSKAYVVQFSSRDALKPRESFAPKVKLPATSSHKHAVFCCYKNINETFPTHSTDGMVSDITRKYKESLGLPQKLVIGYQAHADTATKSNSITKNKFVV
ncbi:hypothetical protein DNTS_033177 [Danionella cerebrum]|uniref:Eukaryotic translation initiation factor 4E type 1B n=1 Tax=Danionella cerebrum TaxID=2873325 RepID=A0A553P964_9TELE|nr:hypothetical protein DNTS_033177 [Danionella translucida]